MMISAGYASKIAQKAKRVPSGFHARFSSHAYGLAAFARYTSVGGVTTLPSSHTSTRLSPSDFTTVSSIAVTIAIRLPSCVTANSRM